MFCFLKFWHYVNIKKVFPFCTKCVKSSLASLFRNHCIHCIFLLRYFHPLMSYLNYVCMKRTIFCKSLHFCCCSCLRYQSQPYRTFQILSIMKSHTFYQFILHFIYKMHGLQYHNAYGHQTRKGGDTLLATSTHKVTLSFSHAVLWDQVTG